MCRYCWDDVATRREKYREWQEREREEEDYRAWVGMTPQSRDDRDYLYPREEMDTAWEATPDYDELIAREGGDDEMTEAGEEDREYGQVWLVAEGLRPIPNREHYA